MNVIDRNSVAYRLALVASGAVDAALALNSKNDWDLAAGDLIVREAGGRVSSHDGQTLMYNTARPSHRSFVASGPLIYDALFSRVGQLKLRSQHTD